MSIKCSKLVGTGWFEEKLILAASNQGRSRGPEPGLPVQSEALVRFDL